MRIKIELLVLLPLGFGEDVQHTDEHLEEVGEKSDGVSHDITNSGSSLLNDPPGIDKNVSTDDNQTQTDNNSLHRHERNEAE